MPASDAIKYAEGALGVHRVYEKAVESRETLDETLTDLGKARDLLRDHEFRLSDREMEVASDERGRHPEMSATAMEKHLKIALNNDDAVRELREQVARIRSDIEGLDYDREIAETDIRIQVARMNELAGYFQYLAVVKDVAHRKEADSARPVATGT